MPFLLNFPFFTSMGRSAPNPKPGPHSCATATSRAAWGARPATAGGPHLRFEAWGRLVKNWALGSLGGFHSHGESPIAGWVIREKPNITWMIWGYPYFRKPPIGVWYIMQDHARPCKTQVCDLDHIAQSILKFLKPGLADFRLDHAQQVARHTFEFLSTGASLVRLEADWWREH